MNESNYQGTEIFEHIDSGVRYVFEEAAPFRLVSASYGGVNERTELIERETFNNRLLSGPVYESISSVFGPWARN